MINRQEILLKILGWGTAAIFVVSGWFINPSTTQYIYVDNGKKNRAMQVDLISLDENKPHSVIDGAQARAKSLLLFSGAAFLVWWFTIFFTTRMNLINFSEKIRGKALICTWTYVIAVSTLYTLLILNVVDII